MTGRRDFPIRAPPPPGPSPRILPDIFTGPYLLFTGPYLLLEPELAFVLLDTEDRPAGCIVGTADTPPFVAAYRREWLPRFAGRYPWPGAHGSGEDRDAERTHELHHPEWMLRDDLTDYPAHLHIALAPQAQGKGAGRALMDTYLEALRAAGVPRVHLSMSAANIGARAFYDRLGFQQIARPTPTRVLLGRRTQACWDLARHHGPQLQNNHSRAPG